MTYAAKTSRSGFTFARGLGVAFVLSVAGALIDTLLGSWLTQGLVERLLIVLLSFGYFACLLPTLGSGRIAATVLWSFSALFIWIALPEPIHFLLANLGLFSVSRMILLRTTPLLCLLDIFLVSFGAWVASWAATTSGSLTLTLWCFFLVQAAIGLRFERQFKPQAAVDRFEQSYSTAQAALRRLMETQR